MPEFHRTLSDIARAARLLAPEFLISPALGRGAHGVVLMEVGQRPLD